MKCVGCPHGRITRKCAQCRPCPHGAVRVDCVACQGACPHGKVRRKCARCGKKPAAEKTAAEKADGALARLAGGRGGGTAEMAETCPHGVPRVPGPAPAKDGECDACRRELTARLLGALRDQSDKSATSAASTETRRDADGSAPKRRRGGNA